MNECSCRTGRYGVARMAAGWVGKRRQGMGAGQLYGAGNCCLFGHENYTARNGASGTPRRSFIVRAQEFEPVGFQAARNLYGGGLNSFLARYWPHRWRFTAHPTDTWMDRATSVRVQARCSSRGFFVSYLSAFRELRFRAFVFSDATTGISDFQHWR